MPGSRPDIRTTAPPCRWFVGQLDNDPSGAFHTSVDAGLEHRHGKPTARERRHDASGRLRMRNTAALLVLACTAAVGTLVVAQSPPSRSSTLRIPFESYALPNGLRVVLAP